MFVAVKKSVSGLYVVDNLPLEVEKETMCNLHVNGIQFIIILALSA